MDQATGRLERLRIELETLVDIFREHGHTDPLHALGSAASQLQSEIKHLSKKSPELIRALAKL